VGESDFDKFSPHRFAANFKTPTLIIHNELDFRVPIARASSSSPRSKRKGIPSRFLSFPDEGTGCSKPREQRALAPDGLQAGSPSI